MKKVVLTEKEKQVKYAQTQIRILAEEEEMFRRNKLKRIH